MESLVLKKNYVKYCVDEPGLIPGPVQFSVAYSDVLQPMKSWVGPGDESFFWSQTQNQPSAEYFQYCSEDTHWMKLRAI